MALINCPECGHQMSDTAKKCPNCGYKQTNKFQYKGFKNLYIGLLLSVISVALLILAMPTMSGFSMSSEIYLTDDDFWYGILEVVASCILFLLGCKLFKQYTSQTNKIVLTFIGIAVLATVINMFCHGVKLKDDYCYNENVSNVHNTAMEENMSEDNGNNDVSAPVGTYQVTDKAGKKWVINVNEDETIVIEGTDNSAYYGSWRLYKGKIETSFTSDSFYPPLIFPNSESTDGMYLVIDLKDKFIYASNSAESKNPRKRLSITKVK